MVTLTAEETFTPKMVFSSVEEIKNILLLGSLYFNNVKKNILTTKSKNNRRTNSHGH